MMEKIQKHSVTLRSLWPAFCVMMALLPVGEDLGRLETLTILTFYIALPLIFFLITFIILKKQEDIKPLKLSLLSSLISLCSFAISLTLILSVRDGNFSPSGITQGFLATILLMALATGERILIGLGLFTLGDFYLSRRK